MVVGLGSDADLVFAPVAVAYAQEVVAGLGGRGGKNLLLKLPSFRSCPAVPGTMFPLLSYRPMMFVSWMVASGLCLFATASNRYSVLASRVTWCQSTSPVPSWYPLLSRR